MSQSPQSNKMGTMPIFPLLMRMAFPLMISMLIQALYYLIDSMFVSLVSENAFTAVSLAYPLQNLMIALGVGTGVGVAALVARHLGEGNPKEAQSVARNGLFLGCCSAVLFAIIGLVGMELYFSIQTTDPEIFAYGVEYTRICSICSIGLFMSIIFERLVQSTGRTIFAMYSQGLGAIVNVILDPILIFGLCGLPAMGVKGAAWATVIGQCSSMCLGAHLAFHKNPELPISLKGFHPRWDVIRRIYVIGIPVFLSQGIGSVMVYAMNLILIGFTSTATAIFGAFFKLMSFASMPVFGLMNAMTPIVAYNYGAKNPKRIAQAFRCGWAVATAILTLACITFLIFPAQLLSFFSPSADMLAIGTPALRIMGLHFIPAAFCMSTMGLFQGLGRAAYSMTCSFIRQLIVLVPVAYLLSLSGNLDLVWWAMPIAEIFSVTAAALFLRHVWRSVIPHD